MINKVAGLRLLCDFFPGDTIRTIFAEEVAPTPDELKIDGEGQWYVREGRTSGNEWGLQSRVFDSASHVSSYINRGLETRNAVFATHPIPTGFWHLSYAGAIAYWAAPTPTIQIAFQATSLAIIERLRRAQYSPRELDVEALFTYDYLVARPSSIEGREAKLVGSRYPSALYAGFGVGRWMSGLNSRGLICRFLLSSGGRLILTDLRTPGSLLRPRTRAPCSAAD